MDSSSVKTYHECDPNDFIDKYFSPTTDKKIFDEIVIFPKKVLQKLNISGDVLVDYSHGPIIFHLLTICENFNKFIILEESDASIKELEKWVNKEQDLDWCQLSQSFPELGSDWKKWPEKGEILRRKLKPLMICNLDKDNPTAPFVVEKADCVLSAYVLQNICKDKESFSKKLKKLCSFIKVDGHLFLVGTFDAQYYTIGEHTFHMLTLDEKFIRNTVANEGFTIDHLQVQESTLNADYVKYGHVFCLHALKQREV